MGRIRNSKRTQSRILAAAREEFARGGYRGGRLDAIARRAGVNKRMLYHYFNSKEGLFAAVLESSVDEEPADWQALRENALLRVWASLDSPVQPPGWEADLEALKKSQRAGQLPVELSPLFLQLALLGVEVLPLLLPQLVQEKGIGLDPSDVKNEERGKRFRRNGQRFKKALLDILARQAQQAPRDHKGKQRIRLETGSVERAARPSKEHT